MFILILEVFNWLNGGRNNSYIEIQHVKKEERRSANEHQPICLGSSKVL